MNLGPETAFSLASGLAMLGWLLLVGSLFAPAGWRARLAFVAGRAIPFLLAAGYAVALASSWGEASGRGGGFGSLAEVTALFSVPGLLLAGWIHYLAFDLLVGRWQVDDAAAGGARGPAAWWLVPCLVLTFLVGPVGWLAYLGARAVALRPRSRAGS